MRQLRDAANETGVHFLDNDEIVINGVRFLGATLWTDFLLFGHARHHDAKMAGMVGLNDFRKINEGGLVFTPSDAIALCNTSSQWLKSKLHDEQFEGKTVVITHHLPSMKSVVDNIRASVSSCVLSYPI